HRRRPWFMARGLSVRRQRELHLCFYGIGRTSFHVRCLRLARLFRMDQQPRQKTMAPRRILRTALSGSTITKPNTSFCFALLNLLAARGKDRNGAAVNR